MNTTKNMGTQFKWSIVVTAQMTEERSNARRIGTTSEIGPNVPKTTYRGVGLGCKLWTDALSTGSRQVRSTFKEQLSQEKTMRGEPTGFWGKLERHDGEVTWHPLVDHCADVAVYAILDNMP